MKKYTIKLGRNLNENCEQIQMQYNEFKEIYQTTIVDLKSEIIKQEILDLILIPNYPDRDNLLKIRYDNFENNLQRDIESVINKWIERNSKIHNLIKEKSQKIEEIYTKNNIEEIFVKISGKIMLNKVLAKCGIGFSGSAEEYEFLVRNSQHELLWSEILQIGS